jgi:ankyrin repeat protein
MSLSGEELLDVASNGNLDELRALLNHPDFNKGAVRKATDDGGNTALHKAAIGGRVECVIALLEAGADIEAKNLDGSSPLSVSCSLPDCGATAQALLDHGADVNSSPANEQMPICEACRHARVEIVRLLLSRGASPEATNFSIFPKTYRKIREVPASYPWQPIHYAVRSGSVECIDLLIKAGARLNLPGKYDESALVEAITHRKFECARFLLKHGADVEHLNCKCESPLGRALMDPESGSFVSMLYQFGANMYLRRRDGIEGIRVPHHPLWDWLNNGSSPEPLRALVMADTAGSVGNDRWKFWQNRALFIVLSGNSISHLIQFINICHGCGHLLDMNVKFTDKVSQYFVPAKNRTLVEQSFRAYMHHHGQIERRGENELGLLRVLLAAGASATERCGNDETLSPLEIACQKRLTEAANVMIEGHVWSKKEKYQTTVKFGPVIKSLQAWCRHAIRSTLGRKRISQIRRLPLSFRMKDYLLFDYPLFRDY